MNTCFMIALTMNYYTRQWTDRPFATRLIDGGPDRVTLLADRIRFRRDGVWAEHPVAPDDWNDVLARWFDMEP